MRNYWCSECRIGFDSDAAGQRPFEMIGEDTEYIPTCPACGDEAMPATICDGCGEIVAELPYTHGQMNICEKCKNDLLTELPTFAVCKRCNRVIDGWLLRGEGCHLCEFEKQIGELSKAMSGIFGINMVNKIKVAVKAKGDTK